ncbi:hypothetical protein B0H10DRAFT_1793853 [Mycena sp. CBHHK59/15]|nr:hypothetical protein B0H10DRAFT_1793853 [Mycena sp. CBHHK59/15]
MSESHQVAAKLWSIYIDEAERYDTALVESWKGDMEFMLIFSGLFSSSLTVFLIESYKNLQPDSGDMTVELLSTVSWQLVALSHNSPLTTQPLTDFCPTLAALACNTLWLR